MEKFTEVAV